MRKILTGCIVLILLICASGFAGAEEKKEAEEIKSGITFASNARNQDYRNMQDDDFATYFPLKDQKGWLEVRSEEPVWGIYLMQFEKITVPLSYDLQVKDSAGEWKTVAQGGEYLVHWHPLEEGVTEFRIFGTGKERIRVAELRLYGEGEKPREAQDWKNIDKCDMMLISAHPDDETLWFAGLLPTYAGERGLRVQLAVMAPTGGERKLELLHAIWHSGVTAYPEFIGLVDKNGKTVEGQYSAWKGRNRVLNLVTDVIRKHQPEVIVTHGEKGEYGHGAHKAACDAAKQCVKLAAKSGSYPKSAKKYGVWQVKKLYLHEYTKRVIPCDWSVPLEAFGGKTGYEVAAESFQFHRSQIRRDWMLEPDGAVRNKKGVLEHDNSLFGLYFTKVGDDTGIGDFMEHIDAE